MQQIAKRRIFQHEVHDRDDSQDLKFPENRELNFAIECYHYHLNCFEICRKRLNKSHFHTKNT